MSPIVFSPTEIYRVIVVGEDLAHLLELIDQGDRFCTDDCPRCKRIRNAVGTAEFHALGEAAA